MNRVADEFIDLPLPETHSIFDLTMLLKQNDLDIQEAAGADPKLTVGKYCDLLSQFITLAPDASDIIKKFAEHDFKLEKKEYKNLEKFLSLLEEIKCNQFAVDFHFLKNAYRKKANRDLAANHAKQMMDNFDAFIKRLIQARHLDESNLSMPLRDYINENYNHRKPVILAVDDSPDILKAIYSVLKDDYKVIPLSHPEQLENTLNHVTPDLFLLDYRMPEINGFDLIPIIRKKHPDTPIIFLTAVGTIDHKSAAVMLGACDFLVKPLKADVLHKTIARHIS